MKKSKKTLDEESLKKAAGGGNAAISSVTNGLGEHNISTAYNPNDIEAVKEVCNTLWSEWHKLDEQEKRLTGQINYNNSNNNNYYYNNYWKSI